MRKKYYKEFEKLVGYRLTEVCVECRTYIYQVKKITFEDRVRRGTYGGYEDEELARKFEKEIKEKLDVFLEWTYGQFERLNRKLSKKQEKELSKRVSNSFNFIVEQFETELPSIIGEVPETVKTMINCNKENLKNKVYNYFKVMNFGRKYYYDKYFFWTIFNATIAAVCATISLVTLLRGVFPE